MIDKSVSLDGELEVFETVLKSFEKKLEGGGDGGRGEEGLSQGSVNNFKVSGESLAVCLSFCNS